MNKQVRGYILKVCKLSYPQAVGSNVVDVCLVDAGMGTTFSLLEGHLKYLEERGYVVLKATGVSALGSPIILATLSAKGIDLLEGTVKDPGVSF